MLLRTTKNHVKVMDPATGRLSKQYSLDEFKGMDGSPSSCLPQGAILSNPINSQVASLWHLRLLKPHRSTLIQALFGAILGTFLALTGSFYIQKVVDSVIS